MLVVVVLGVVLYVQARHADQRLRDARAAVARLRADLVRPDVTQATLDADAVAVVGPARAAADITDGGLWSLAVHVPVVGSAVRSARGTSDAVRDLAVGVLPDLTRVQAQLRTDQLQKPGGIRLAPLRSAAPTLTRAAADMTTILGRVRALPASTPVGAVDRAHRDLVAQLTSLSGQVGDAAAAARVLPDMLGGAGTRRYFLGFESSSESRALGGLPGAFGILEATDGTLRLAQVGSDAELAGVTTDVDLGAAYDAEFGSSAPTKLYQNSDVSAHFPDAARIWIGMWKTKTGEDLDGAIVVDPSALAGLLAITGGTTTASGTPVTAENVVDLTQRKAYVDFAGDDAARKDFLLQVAKAAGDKLVSAGPAHATALVHAAAKEVGERRILVYSAHPAEQAVLAEQPIAGLVPAVTGPNAVTGPYLYVGLNNAGGNKLDYFLDRTVTYRADRCAGAARGSTVTIALTNAAPAGLPTSVTGPGFAHDGRPLDTNREVVLVYLTAGAGVLDATVDGKAVQVSSGVQQGRPVVGVDVIVPRGATSTVVLHLLEPTAAKGAATVVAQPMVRPQATTVDVPAC